MITPPLKVWTWSILISVLLLLSLTCYLQFFGSNLNLANDEIKKAFDQASQNRDIKILLLGNSLTQQGISDPDELEKLLSHRADKNVSIVKLVRGGAQLEYFIENDFFKHKLSEFKPDYLIIQEAVFCFERSGFLYKYHLRHYFTFGEFLRRLISKNTSNTMQNDNSKVGNSIDTTQLLPLKKRAIQKKIRSSGDSVLLNHMLKKTDANDTKLLILRVPYPHPIELAMDSLRATDKYTNYRKWTIDRYNAQYINAEMKMPFRNYFDHGHMNDKGEKIFTKWFINEMAEIIMKDSTIRDRAL